jgi:hypothetical protein
MWDKYDFINFNMDFSMPIKQTFLAAKFLCRSAANPVFAMQIPLPAGPLISHSYR